MVGAANGSNAPDPSPFKSLVSMCRYVVDTALILPDHAGNASLGSSREKRHGDPVPPTAATP
jgi:hypothetical protein